MSNPTVSVVIPSYNHEKYIEDTIKSVLNQTFQDFDIIITDDGSSDGTVEKIKKFSDPRIKLFVFEENQGACRALNNCILNSKGKYVAYVSSDDIWEPEKLEKQVKFLDNNLQIAVVFTKVKIIDENSNPFIEKDHFYYSVFDQENRSNDEWLRTFFFHGNCICHPSALFRREVYDKVGLYNEAMANLPDFDMWIRLCLKHNIHILDDTLIKFRIRDENANASSSGNPRNLIRNRFEWKQVFDHYLKIDDVDFFLKIFPDAERYGRVKKSLIPYFLGRLAYDTKWDIKQLWGLEIIFNLIKSSEIVDILEKDYDFKYADFINMSAEADVFKLVKLQQEKGNQKNEANQEKEDFYLKDDQYKDHYKELHFQVDSITHSIYEMEYFNNNNRSFMQRLFSKSPTLYILFKGKKNGIKNAFINIRGYNAIKKNNLLDIGFYLNNCPDVRRSGADPILHYIFFGFNEGRRPNPTFDGDYYIKTHKDVLKMNMNPLVHYSLYGMKEERRTISPNYIEKKERREKTRSAVSSSHSSNISTLRKGITGEINIFSDEPVVFGWLAKIGDINPRTAILKIDDNVFEVVCDFYRSDLKEANINDGYHAFEFIVPIDFIDGKKHQVQLLDKHSGEIIANRELNWTKYNINETRKKQLKIKLNDEKKKLNLLESNLRLLEDENRKILTLTTCNDFEKTDSLKLNVGCGSVKFPGWVNIDIEPNADLVVDLRNGLPLKDNTADFIYNEHFIEHLSFEDGEKAVKEFYRVLKGGGVLRIATPELNYIIEKYVNDWKDQDWLSWPHYSYITTKGRMLNIAMREWGHEYLYNEEDLRNLLKKIGFKKITKQELNKSKHHELSDRETRKDSKLILEAEK
mgnify:CR=1 FL=1|jgi:predicted SAM-dependent methyltransferase/glycosyltransferase involved in cell wall biosynthesis